MSSLSNAEPGVLALRARLRDPSPLLVGVACLGLAGLADAVLRHEAGVSGDERYYERMASHPSGPHNFPFAYRIGVPWLVHMLPFSHVVSFTLLALLAIAASGAVMFVLFRQFTIRPDLAAALSLGFAMSPAMLVVLLRHGRSVDAAAVLVITLGTLFIVRRQRLALGVTLLIATTIHESCMFLVPLAYAVWAERLLDLRALRDLALVAIAPLALYALIRTQVDAVGAHLQPGYSGPFLDARFDILQQGLSGGELSQEARRIAYAFGPLWLVAPFALRTERFARRGLVLVAMCLIGMSFAFGWGRIIFFAAPVFYVAGARMLDGRRRLALAVVLALLAMDIGYAIYMQVYGVQHGIDSTISTSLHTPVY